MATIRGTANAANEIATCAYCGKEDDGKGPSNDMVQCDECQKWVHFHCAGVDKSVAEQAWSCSICRLKIQQVSRTPPKMTQKADEVSLHSGKVSDKSSVKSDTTFVSKSTAKNKSVIKLELELLERKKKIELEFLEKQRELLSQLNIEEEEEEEELELGENKKSNNEDENNIRTQATAAWVKKCQPQYYELLAGNTEPVNKTLPPALNLERQHQSVPLACNAAHQRAAVPQSTAVLQDITLQQNLVTQLSARHAFSRDLPNFSGKPEEWPLFISSFQNSTRLCGFTDDENLLRLQRALKGRALDCVSSKLLIPSLVPEIISTLRMMFGRPDHLINASLTKIRGHPNVHPHKLESLISFSLELKNVTATMEASGLEGYINNPLLVQELIEKLPTHVRMDWAKHKMTNNQNDLKALSDWLYTIAEQACSVTSVPVFTTTNYKTHSLNFHEEQQSTTVPKVMSCYLCSKEHMMVHCKDFLKLDYNERWNKTKQMKLCYTCLKKHNTKICRDFKECQINGCTKKHHPLLHRPIEDNEPESSATMTAYQHQETSDILYRVVPVTISANEVEIDLYAFLDDGSGVTLIENKIIEDLQIKGERIDLCLRWTDGTTRVEKGSIKTNLNIASRQESEKKYSLNNVRSVESLNLPAQTMIIEELAKKYKHLRGLQIESYRNVVPRMIIGINNRFVAMPLKCREGGPQEPAATKTRLGWTVYGEINGDSDKNSESLQLHVCECDNEMALQSLMTNHWKVDTINHGSNKMEQISIQQEKLNDRIEDRGDYFVTKLLWKAENIKLDDNYNMALQRLKCFERKLKKEPELKQYVENHIKSMMEKGYVKKLDPQEIVHEHPRKWYLPIFAVRNPNKPKKIRLVWDAAAKYRGVSLNDCLDKGPDMLNSLIEVLFSFRVGKFGICGDICEMFHRVHVDEADQSSQRFLWRNDELQTPEVYVLCVLSFGASCSPALAQYVKNQNALRFKDKYPRAVKSIIERHYVDDMLDSVDTEEEAVKLAMDVREVHKQGNFHMRNWMSNSKDVVDAMGETGEAQGELKFCGAGQRIDQVVEPTKVLGLWWNNEADIFTFNLKFTKANEDVLKGVTLPTKRQLLRLMMSIFDPLGFLSFYLVNVKILFQQIWRSGIGWDDEIPVECAKVWRKWLAALPEAMNVKIPRHYFGHWKSADCKIGLHIFVDAGESAFAAVAFYRIENGNNVKTALIGSKAKVAPLRPLSIPRMELMAAVLGAKLGDSIIKGHDLIVEEIQYWTDSKNVLSWLRSDPMTHQQFITYRLGEIHEITDVKQWKYVPSKLNVADMATKPSENIKIDDSNIWFQGPEFLAQERERWPTQPIVQSSNEELRKNKLHLVAAQTNIESIINYSRFSKWERILQTMANVKHFINILKNKVAAKRNALHGADDGHLKSEDIVWSHNFLCRIAQRECYSYEIAELENNCNFILPKKSALRTLSPFIDAGLMLRIRGRLENAQFIDETSKNPIILPKHHKMTMLLVDFYHRKNRHTNHEGVINEIFQKYHISGLRQVLRKVREACQVCKNRRAQPQPPEMGSLPEGRLSPYSRPFTHVGLDFFGPFLTSVGRRTEKRYGVVFTCLTCRAVHVEMAYSLSMNSCVMVIRNFIARRGNPRVFYSDNGTNLRAAEKELKAAVMNINFDQLQTEFTNEQTDWKFIPPASPHMGGAWERMVRSIKHVLYHIVTPDTKLNDEKLQNLLLEVENIVNSRPLTYLALDNAEQEALTPNHFLLGSTKGQKPPGEFNITDKYVKNSWRHSQYLADCFWKRWVAEVLPTLTRRTTWFQKAKPLEPGDVVVIVDPNSPRYSWPKGVIIQTITGKDGQTRSAIVRTAQGQYHRPAAKLAVLDVKQLDDEFARP